MMAIAIGRRDSPSTSASAPGSGVAVASGASSAAISISSRVRVDPRHRLAAAYSDARAARRPPPPEIRAGSAGRITRHGAS
jgi:hypothetical protein